MTPTNTLTKKLFVLSSLSLICDPTKILRAFVITNSVTQQKLNPLTKPTKAQSHDSDKYTSNQKTLRAL